MRLWYFTEQQFHPGWEKVRGPIRNTPNTEVIDPEEAADLIDRYYEEFAIFDEMGLNIAVNEHHTSLQSMSTTPFLSVAALARTTKKARLLSIGTPLAQRPDPVRVAEEIALTDVMSRGRTEVGFIKSVPWEYFNANQNPVRLMDRFWEAADLIQKALTTGTGPFHWSGEFFHYRNVNVVPPPYQKPFPPIWMSGQSPNSARVIADKDWTCVTSMSGGQAVPFLAAYRDQYRKTHGRAAPLERTAYLCYLAVGSNEAEARGRAQKVHKWVEFLASQSPAYQHAAGYAPAQDFARMIRGDGLGQFAGYTAPNIDELRERNIMFWGTPDQVYEQFAAYLRKIGGAGNILTQMGGYADKAETVDSMRLMKTEVWPRLQAFAATLEPA